MGSLEVAAGPGGVGGLEAVRPPEGGAAETQAWPPGGRRDGAGREAQLLGPRHGGARRCAAPSRRARRRLVAWWCGPCGRGRLLPSGEM